MIAEYQQRVRRHTGESRRRHVVRRADYERLTRGQRRWVDHRGKVQLWRDGNQVGKTRGLVRKLLHFLERTGPYADRRPGPKRVLVVSFSKEQMVALHLKLWELLPKDDVDASVEFTPGFGFRGKPPRILFVRGKADGCLIEFATYKQGSQRLAGPTYDLVVLDEPVPERVFGEIQPRVLHGDPGEIWITFTPTPDSPPLEYLRKMVDAGDVAELNFGLSVETVTFEDGVGALLTEERIRSFEKTLLDVEKDMRMKGGWEPVFKDRLLTNWGPHCLSSGRLRPPAGAILAVGIDHGAGAGKQAAVLLALVQVEDLAPKIWILEEYVASGYTTPEQDARAILDMLERRGLEYDHVDHWLGDRATNANKWEIRKSNGDIRRHIAALLRRPMEKTRYIVTPKKWHGSVFYGFRLMNAIMGRKDADGRSHFLVDHAACPKFAEAAQKFRGASKDPAKDILDGGRYPIERLVRAGSWHPFRAVFS